MWYREEIHAVKGPVKTFDNRCSSDFEKVAEVLQLAGFIEFVDEIRRRSMFVCDPNQFEAIANSKKANGIDPVLVEEAVRALATGIYRSSDEIEWLAENSQESI